MTTRLVEIHDKCTECGRVLLSIKEGESGKCSSCWFKTIPKDTKSALNKLIAAAFKPTSEAEKDALVDEALEKLKRDKESRP